MDKDNPQEQNLRHFRPPRLHITYDVELGDTIERRELPFIIGVLSDLSGVGGKRLPDIRDRTFVEIDRDNFNDVLAVIEPRVSFDVEDLLTGNGGTLPVELRFRHMDDFEPVRIINQLKPMAELFKLRHPLLDRNIETDDAELAHIDDLLSRQLSLIMHASELQRLEASWRGLLFLVSKTETSAMLKIRVLNVSKDELRRDMEGTVNFVQSALFQKIYEEPYGTFGGEPYAGFIGDYEFGLHPQDTSLLEQISHVAACAHAPFIAAAHPNLFGLDSFTDLGRPRDLAKIFDGVEYVKWNSFRESEDSRYMGLTMPRILLRLPYGPDTVPVGSFNFKEEVKEHSEYLWGNAACAFATRLTDSFARHGFCEAVCGIQDGRVEGLATHVFMTDNGDVALNCPTEIAIKERREWALSNLGFIPLLHWSESNYAVFLEARSCQRPKVYDSGLRPSNWRVFTEI